MKNWVGPRSSEITKTNQINQVLIARRAEEIFINRYNKCWYLDKKIFFLTAQLIPDDNDDNDNYVAERNLFSKRAPRKEKSRSLRGHSRNLSFGFAAPLTAVPLIESLSEERKMRFFCLPVTALNI